MKRTEEFGVGLTIFFCLIAPTLGWVYGWIRLFSSIGMPREQAFPLGIVVGILVGGLVIRLSGDKLLEVGCTAIPMVSLFLILVPMLQQARVQAQEKQCQRNLSQLAARLQGYAARHKGHLPEPEKWQALSRCPTSKQPYIYEAGKAGILLRDAGACHREHAWFVLTDGTLKRQKASTSPATPPSVRLAQGG